MRTYDGAGQLKTLKDETKAGEVISDFAYEYDGRGNIVKISGMEAGSMPGAEGSMSGGETVTRSRGSRIGTARFHRHDL